MSCLEPYTDRVLEFYPARVGFLYREHVLTDRSAVVRQASCKINA